jgi:hypothetical protein
VEHFFFISKFIWQSVVIHLAELCVRLQWLGERHSTETKSQTWWTSVTKGISPDYISARSCFELSSDHTPILITLSVETSPHSPHPILCNNNMNWEAFRLLITEHLQRNIPLKTTHNIEAVINSFNNLIQ